MNRQRLLAIVTLGAAGYAVFRASRRLESAAEDIKRRGLSGDVIVAMLLAVAALALAVKKSGDAGEKLGEAF